MNGLPIGEVARRAGLRPSALRYYERIGLIPSQPRASGQRRYDSTVFSALAVIDAAKRAGFSIAETKFLFTGFGAEVAASARWRAMARRKQEELDRAITDARQMKKLLSLALECRCATLADCGRRIRRHTAKGETSR